MDAGDVDAPPVGIEKCYAAVEAGDRRRSPTRARIPLVVGGDHSISLPFLRALAGKHGPLALVQFDAHIDTWDEYFGGKYFHGTPFRRAIEEGIIDRHAGTSRSAFADRCTARTDFEFQREHGVTMIDIDRCKRGRRRARR